MSDFTGLPITVIDTTSIIAPTLNFDPVAGDDIINDAERTAGVTLTGTRVMDATVALCIRGSDDACTGGEVRTFFSGDTPTTWRYTLTTADYNLMGEGEVDLRILGERKPITVDLTPPVAPAIDHPDFRTTTSSSVITPTPSSSAVPIHRKPPPGALPSVAAPPMPPT